MDSCGLQYRSWWKAGSLMPVKLRANAGECAGELELRAKLLYLSLLQFLEVVFPSKNFMKPFQSQDWHAKTVEEVTERLECALRSGLEPDEVIRRRRDFGLNQMTPAARRPGWLRFLMHFNQSLVHMLLVATLISVWLGEWVDAAVIFAVILINAVVGYLQESRAEKAIEALAKMVVTEANVRRAGEVLRIPSVELVPGDVVLVQSGDRIPADLRLFQARNLQVEEAALTGESLPVTKQTGILSEDTGLADRTNQAWMGTLVRSGQGEGVVLAIGDGTEMGRIAKLMGEAEELKTPLTQKIAKFSRLLVQVILILAALTFGLGIWRGEAWESIFMASIALAVGAIPEGLPAALTITLAVGVARMAKRRVIMRRLPAVETLGSTTVICSDKTGTLTQNQMTVREIYAAGVMYHVTGSGYDSEGELNLADAPLVLGENAALVETLGAGILCNDSRLVHESDGRISVLGDPTEAALLVSARKAGVTLEEFGHDLPRVESLPFESEYQYMATLHGSEGAPKLIYIKGAVEVLIERCFNRLSAMGNLENFSREEVLAAADKMAARGLRVLAFARRAMPEDHEVLEHGNVAEQLTFLGLQGKLDPPRPEAILAVKQCQRAGIDVKMITGDHALTARSIAEQIGLNGASRVVNGSELETLSDEELASVAEHSAVFARVVPEQKLRLVKALQARGQVVAMTGDGVNDAPALKQADIGIAMGITGTDVSKEAADMILTDDNFASIEAAVEEGRGVFDNLTKFIVWTLPTNFGEGLVILLAIGLGTDLPILPVQILWINMTTAILLGLMLVFEPKEDDIMARPPRDPKEPILTKWLQLRILLVSVLLLGGCFFLFEWERSMGASLQEARTVAVNVFVMGELFYLFNCRSFTRSMFAIGIGSNPWVLVGAVGMLVLQALFTYSPWMHGLFQSAPISGESWVRILAVGVLVYAVVGVEKYLTRRFRARG